MKRFLVFAWDTYYPSGGWNDFQQDFSNLEEAITAVKFLCRSLDHGQVIDTLAQEIVYNESDNI